MARRLNVQRLMMVMGVLVLGLGAVSAYAISQGGRWTLEPEVPGERVYAQVRAQMGWGSEVRYVTPGAGPVMCGYAGYRGHGEAIAFISRPNRILFETDPLAEEFAEMKTRDCATLPEPPHMPAIP